VLRFEVSRSVTTAQCEFRARFKEYAPHKNNVFRVSLSQLVTTHQKMANVKWAYFSFFYGVGSWICSVNYC
jgi:hypothetical protein